MLNQITRRSISYTQTLKNRLIKFRYGASKDQQIPPASSAPGQPSHQSSGVAIWDFELPPRYKRKTLDDQEIAIINNGGPL